MMIMNFLYLLLVVAISEGFSVAPTTAQARHHPQEDIHEWFTESLHEAETGEIKISSDDSWIAQQFHIISPSSLLLPPATLEARCRNTNEWMTQAMEFGVVGPTADRSRRAASSAAGAVVPQNCSSGRRSDGFVETMVNAPIPGHIITTTTTTKKNNSLGRSPGRADWFGDSIFTSNTPTPPIVLGEHKDDDATTSSSTTKPIAATAVRAPSPQSADWFLQAMYDHWDATVGKQAYC